MDEIVIVGAQRTPIGKFGGQLAALSAIDLGVHAAKGVLSTSGVSAELIDLAIFGSVLQAGLGQNPARQIAYHTGIPVTTPAMTVNEVCGSGLKAIMLGVQALRLNEASFVLSGGSESMSNAPYLVPHARWGARFGHQEWQDCIVRDGLTDAFSNESMGVTAERVATQFGIDRAAQDAYAYQSHRKAAHAEQNGWFDAERLSVSYIKKGQTVTITNDEGIRAQLTTAQLAALKPAFSDADGTVTAGNASSLNDGAAAVLLTRKDTALQHKLPILATVRASAEVGIDPNIMGFAPFSATQAALQKAGLTLADIDLIEANEAFAAQCLAVKNALAWDDERVNICGGAIALGHPIGASGARIVTTLTHQLWRTNKRYGLATLCVGGGLGLALIIERP